MKFEALKDKKRGLILSTDIAGDCDDVGAIKLLHTYADELGFNILGICNCTTRRDGTRTVYALNKFASREDITLGEYDKHTLPEGAETSKYIDEISRRFGEGCPEPLPAAKFYRKLLSEAEDDGVVIVTIGFFTDLAELMKSAPDEYSPLSGIELMKRKVSHVVSMALKYPSGVEFNIRLAPDEAKYCFDNMPVDIFISDFDVGWNLRSGFYGIDRETPSDNPYIEAYRLFSGAYSYAECDNNSYDLTAIQFAAIGEGEYYRINPTAYHIDFYTAPTQWNYNLPGNANLFVEDKGGRVYRIEATDKALIKAELDRRLSL